MRYEVVYNLRCKSVIDAPDEDTAVKEAMKIRVDRQIISGVKESVVKLGEAQSTEVIKRISDSLKDYMTGKKFCGSCNELKDERGFKKDNWGNFVCKECSR